MSNILEDVDIVKGKYFFKVVRGGVVCFLGVCACVWYSKIIFIVELLWL